MMLMAQANDLIVVFLALELLSIPLYVLAGFMRGNRFSEEASLKYFLLGTFASGFLLYGIAMIFGATSQTNLPAVARAVSGEYYPGLLVFGSLLVLVGFGFKVAASPFNLWVPDVYQGAPTPITGFMSVAVKAAGFAALMRIFIVAFPGLSSDLTPLVWALAALTMLVGNLMALLQQNIKRMLAYSSIAHAGYLLMGFVPFGNGAVVGNVVSAMLFYLLGYGLTSFAAWAVVIVLEQAEGEGLALEDYRGLSKRQPVLALIMSVAMLSFTGIPITLGFWGKLFLFRAALDGGFIGLVLVGLLAAVVSAYYYLRVIAMMYMYPGKPEVRRDGWLSLTALLSALAVVALGVAPYALLQVVSLAVIQLP
jgi:NADH-quinone oxidoreductase subunit N